VRPPDRAGADATPDPTALVAACALYVDHMTAEVVTALDDAGIPAILLKGPSIARWLYPAGGRTYRDSDLLVPPSQFAHAASVLRSLGFRDLQEDFHPCERSAQAVEIAFTRAPGPGDRLGGKVDLHRNLPDLPVPDGLLWSVFDARRETLPVGGVDVPVLDRIGVALHVVLHAMQHGLALHTAEDLRRAIDALPVEGWQEVAQLAEALGIAGVVGLGLRQFPQGADLAGRLGLPHLALADSAYYFNHPWAPRGARLLFSLRSAPTIRDKARIVRRDLIPSPARVRYLSAQKPSLVAGYIRYWGVLAMSIGPAARFVVARRLSTSNRLLLLEAAVCLAASRLAISALPFRWLTFALRHRLGETVGEHDAATRDQGERVAQALQRMGRRVPWTGHCLAQALAGKYMLRRRGIASTLHLGVAKDSKTNLEAHAWLRVGDVVVAGGQDLERFTLLATYS
jgi:Transglutaminase-like superfamily/Uncharacterised nucleotidyltransferase